MSFLKHGKPHYEYPPLEISEKAFEQWEMMKMEENSENTWIQNIYWKLDDVSCVLVEKNDKWINHAYKLIDNVWKIIEKERKSGYEHRAPKKRKTTKSSPEVVSTGCLIDMTTLNLDVQLGD